MNGLITKLNIIKNNTLVKRGQLIYNGSEELCTADERNVPEGLYIVKSVQLTHSNQGCEDNKKKYVHTLSLASVDYDEKGKLSLKSGSYMVSVDNEDLEKNFGIGRKAKKGIYYEYIKDQFVKAGKEGFDPKIDYDTNLMKLGWRAMSKYPVKVPKEEAKDMMRDVLIRSVTSNTIKAYDPKRDILKFFGSIFINNLMTVMKTWTRRKLKEVELEEEDSEDKPFTEEEELEYKKIKDPQETVEEKVGYKELVKGLKNFMKKRVRGGGQLEIFDDLVAGYPGTEIAERHNISTSLVSRFIAELKKSILEYGKITKNVDLVRLMSEYSKNRKYADEGPSFLMDVFKEYKKKFGSDDITNRELSGEITKVKKIVLDDKVSDDAIAQTVLSDSYSSKVLKKDLVDYFSLLDVQDELVESEDGKLTGLKIVGDEVRSIEDQAKCKKRKESKKEKGFFVYSKCGMGPHKVLKIDGTFSIKLNKKSPVKIFKSESQAERAASKYQHTRLVLKVGTYPDEFLIIKEK